MTAVTEDRARPDRHELADELCEDLDVAIREFLERNPYTSSSAIRMALRLAEQRAGGRIRRVAPGLTALAVFVIGFAIGSWLG